MWVQIKVTIFNTLVASTLWIGQRTGHDFFRFVFGKTFHYTDEGWHKLTRNVALFFLATAIANEAVRLGFDDFEMLALNHLFTGVDIWVLFKIFVVMPLTAALLLVAAAAHAEIPPAPARSSSQGRGLSEAGRRILR